MTLKDQLDALLDATAFDSTGVKIGAVRQVYVDDASGKITFATVSTGIFSSDAIVPLHGARLLDDELHVDHTRSVIRDSPRPDHTEDALTPDQEAKLLEYYGIDMPVGDAAVGDTTVGDKAKGAARKPDQPRTATPPTGAAPAAKTPPASGATSGPAPAETTPPAPASSATGPASATSRDEPSTEDATKRPAGGTRAD